MHRLRLVFPALQFSCTCPIFTIGLWWNTSPTSDRRRHAHLPARQQRMQIGSMVTNQPFML